MTIAQEPIAEIGTGMTDGVPARQPRQPASGPGRGFSQCRPPAGHRRGWGRLPPAPGPWIDKGTGSFYGQRMQENSRDPDNGGFEAVEDFEGIAVTERNGTTNVFSGTAKKLVTGGDVHGNLTIDADGIQIDGKPITPR